DVNIYHQVLPLSRKPERGRGSAADVKVGKWLWADLDYKREVESAEFEGCREYDDYALECYYVEGDKIIHVKRPSLGEVLAYVRDKVGDPTIIVDSGAGYHLYFKLSREVDAETLRRLEAWVVDTLGADQHSKDLARILRLPGSVNPRVMRRARVIYTSDAVYDPDELLQRMQLLTFASVHKPRHQQSLRELSDDEILRIASLLKQAYVPGYRQMLCLYLSGWLAKARVSPVSAARIIKILHRSTGDTDPLAQRLSTISYSYRKAGIDITQYIDKIAEFAGVQLYGVGPPIEAEVEVKGKAGIQEIFEAVLDEERAITLLTDLAEIIQAPSPYAGDFIIEIVEYYNRMYNRIYVVADTRRKEIVYAFRPSGTNKLVRKERVAVVVPTRVVIYDNPIGGVAKYEITFESKTRRRPLTIGPALLDEIADRLAAEGLVIKRNNIHDALSALVNGYITRGFAEVRTTIESRGFYHVDGKLVTVGVDMSMPPVDELREALKLLNELAWVWFGHVTDKFATVVKWGASAPFAYAKKQAFGEWTQFLYIYGDAATGKTTLGRIVLKLWGLDAAHEKTGANIDTVPRLGHVLSESTFPVLVNEPGGALSKDDVVEAIKAAVDGRVVRGKYHRGSYVEYPALAPLIFASNKMPPLDDALLRRFRVIHFSFSEKIQPERQEEFKRLVEPLLNKLSAIGRCIAHHVVNNQQLLRADGGELLGLCYDAAGFERPNWLSLEYVHYENPYLALTDEIIERLKKLVNDLYTRYIGRLQPDDPNAFGRFKRLVYEDMLPGVLAIDSETVAITTPLLQELGVGKDMSLKSVAEILGFDYKLVKIGGRVYRAAVAKLSEIEKYLVSNPGAHTTT
ncbi:MAG: hypothetical protein QXS16_02320, partial [Pyrobaculum sp.]